MLWQGGTALAVAERPLNVNPIPTPTVMPMRPNSDGSKPRRRFLVQEVPKELRTPRHRTLMVFDEKTKTNRLIQEPYLPEEPQYDVIVNHTGASLRLLKSELVPLGFDRDPFAVNYDSDEMIPDDGELVNITVESEEITRGSR
jgi:hypothetical protein